jgi:uncharacterized DUF497 family protein
MEFTYDPEKDRINRLKHGFGLMESEAVFYDLFAIVRPDPDHAEERFIAIGTGNQGNVLVVVYTYRGSDTIRVISARRASKNERAAYEEGQS